MLRRGTEAAIADAVTKAVDKHADARSAQFRQSFEADLIKKIKTDADTRVAEFRQNFEADLLAKIDEVSKARDDALKREIADSITRGLNR